MDGGGGEWGCPLGGGTPVDPPTSLGGSVALASQLEEFSDRGILRLTVPRVGEGVEGGNYRVDKKIENYGRQNFGKVPNFTKLFIVFFYQCWLPTSSSMKPQPKTTKTWETV